MLRRSSLVASDETFGAAHGLTLNVSPQSAHRHAVSFVICFASVPTREDPQNGQMGRVKSSPDMKASVSVFNTEPQTCSSPKTQHTINRNGVQYRKEARRMSFAPVTVSQISATILLVLVGLGVSSARAEQADPKHINAAVPTPPPKLIIRAEDLFPPQRPPRLGMFTLVPPEANGEVVRVSIPIGELVSSAARAISDANHRRAERKADARVRKDLDRFLASASGRDGAPLQR